MYSSFRDTKTADTKPNYISLQDFNTHKVKLPETKKLPISLTSLAFVKHVKSRPNKHNKQTLIPLKYQYTYISPAKANV